MDKLPSSGLLRRLELDLAALESQSQLRRPETMPGVNFCSNDYLGLAHRPPPARPSGAGASRLVAGERSDHVELERASAELVGLSGALVFTSGYAANLGLLSALAVPFLAAPFGLEPAVILTVATGVALLYDWPLKSTVLVPALSDSLTWAKKRPSLGPRTISAVGDA